MLNNIDTFIGIDPGKSGAIAVAKSNGMVHSVKMPVTVSELNEFFSQFDRIKTIACIEFVKLRPQDKDGMQFKIATLFKNYTTLKNVMELNGMNFIEVAPKKWMQMLNIYQRGEEYIDRKRRLKRIAQMYFPDQKVTLINADALLITLNLVMAYKNNRKFIIERIPQKKLENYGRI